MICEDFYFRSADEIGQVSEPARLRNGNYSRYPDVALLVRPRLVPKICTFTNKSRLLPALSVIFQVFARWIVTKKLRWRAKQSNPGVLQLRCPTLLANVEKQGVAS
ncbi:MAG: hypothetical protein C0613_16105 [Desulfobulbaceae bacterium]|nr:MAG: hypothetical protein C0613_16105 [Desulfobulbaceae bacterium]